MNVKATEIRGPSTENSNVQHFDLVATGYDDRFGLSVELSRARVRHILDNSIQPIAIGHALDLGCGTGNLTAAMVIEGAANTCIGLDISSGMIGIAKSKTANIGGVSFYVGSAMSLPFADASFDLVVGDAFLHHILDIETCLREVCRVLKPGGVATFNEPNGHGYALVEFILRGIVASKRVNDPQINNYITCIQFLRENRGNLLALEANPLPDKHFFAVNQMRMAGKAGGFSDFSFVPAMGPSPTTWNDAFTYLLDGIGAAFEARIVVMEAANLLDETIGEEARMAFCLHNQFYYYRG